VIDAYLTPRAERAPATAANESATRRTIAGVALAVLLLLTVAPHAVAGYYTYLSRDLLTTVFVSGGDERPGADSSASTETSASPSTTAVPMTSTSIVPVTTVTTTPGVSTSTTKATPSTLSTTTTSTPPETTPPMPGTEDDRLTILLVGSDAGYGRTGSRADTIMVVTIGLVDGRIALFGIPRNAGSVPLSEAAAEVLHRKVYVDLISSLYWDAREHPELAAEGEDSGAVVLRDTVSMLLGIPVDYYAVVDMGGFVDVVDALGGVTVNVKERLWVRLSPPTPDEEWKVYDIRPGIQKLDGLEALAFARSRTGSSDYVRMGRQRCVIAALLDQTGVPELLLRFPTLARVIKESMRTDIPIDRLQDLMRMRSDLKTGEMITVGFTPPKYTDGINEMGYNILDLELVQATVRQIIEHPEEVLAAEETEDIDTSDCWKIE
jgi:LCP family protein required for cell wall assembly